jgi:hypothetical protein
MGVGPNDIDEFAVELLHFAAELCTRMVGEGYGW